MLYRGICVGWPTGNVMSFSFYLCCSLHCVLNSHYYVQLIHFVLCVVDNAIINIIKSDKG